MLQNQQLQVPQQTIQPQCNLIRINQEQQQQQQQPKQKTPQKIIPIPPPIEIKEEKMQVESPVPEGKKSISVKAGKISKKEKQRRRNSRLGKILQPKNAVMILNELQKNIVYNISDVPMELNNYKAALIFEGQELVGYGRSKNEAKNNAAESALKYIIKTRKITPTINKTNDINIDEQMDTTEDNLGDLPWQHVASFALHKLLSTWCDEPLEQTVMKQTNDLESGLIVVNKPAKKLPANAAEMNPLMLVNQMLPHAKFEDVSYVNANTNGSSNIRFTFNCTVNDETFTGSGTSKKAAKREAAFKVCQKVLAINYSLN